MRRVRLPVPAALFVTLVACNSLGLGVTPGGAQDLGLARDLIASGQVPDQEHFTAEGLFSEHDLELPGGACDALLCPRTAAAAYTPLGPDAKPQILVQLGFATSVAEPFERADLDVAAVVDISCSMSGDKIELTQEALHALTDAMDGDDVMSLVTFGGRARSRESRVVMDPRGRARMHEAIDRLGIRGSTDLESGMALGYAQLEPVAGRASRMMLFTDAQPNTGVTEESRFVSMVRDEADRGAHTTVFGVGQDLGSELADAIGRVRGGSYHTLAESELGRLFGTELDYLVTPLAYDLEVTVQGSAELGQVYGAPVDGEAVRFGASTLFLSKRAGGMGATFAVAPEGPVELGSMTLSWLPVDGDERVETTLDFGWDGGAWRFGADSRSVHHLSGLVDEYRALLAAADWCDGADDPSEQIKATADRLSALAEEVSDGTLLAEAQLMLALAENVGTGRTACAPADVAIY
ncbi:MAG: VWA domain-containing protein [Myxococcota bacterium]